MFVIFFIVFSLKAFQKYEKCFFHHDIIVEASNGKYILKILNFMSWADLILTNKYILRKTFRY